MLIKSGESSIQVRYLQFGLKIMCCYTGVVDGNFGPGTQSAVEKFQQDFGLDVDGVVGNETWKCLVDEIKPIQQALKKKGFYKDAINGIAKTSTFTAVKAFQKSRGLSDDGMVGISTKARLFNENENNADEMLLPLKSGDKGDYVLFLQHALRILCCSPGGIDGVYGSGTVGAVTKFQSKYGFPQTGVCDKQTWNKLKQLIREIQKRLREREYNVPSVDGFATSALAEVIKQFQEGNYLTPDGQVGATTYDLLMSNIADGATDALPLKRKSRGSRVLYFQYALRICCINPNGTDGVFGGGTETAVKRYQSKVSLTSDGIVDANTWERMRKDIKPIQAALENKGYDVGIVDGIATEKVYDAVLKYQKDMGLVADGMVGTSTKAMLLGGTLGEGTISSTLKMGSNGSLTLYLQRILKSLEYSVPINGIFDTETRKAVIEFQTSNQLVADGVVGGGTWAKLFEHHRIRDVTSGVDRLISVAKHELNWAFKEDNANNITPYGQWYGMNGSPWCAMFVSYCAHQAGIIDRIVPRFAWCPSGVSWYKARGKYFKRNSGYIPKKGDIIFFHNLDLERVAHTGIVIDGDDHYVTTIEGNTSLNRVQKCTYNRNHMSIDGYGSNGGKDISLPLLPTETEVNTALLGEYQELLNVCRVVLPDADIVLNKEATVPVPPNAKISVEASGRTTIFENLADSPASMEFNITDGVAMAAGVNLGDYVSMTLEGLEGVSNLQDIMDLLLDINTSVDVGNSTIGSGIKTDVEGTWAYLSYAVTKKVNVKEGFPDFDFAYKYTFSVKADGGGKSILQPVFDFIKQYPMENFAIGVALIAVVILIIAYFSGVFAALGLSLLALVSMIIDKVTQLIPVFA